MHEFKTSKEIWVLLVYDKRRYSIILKGMELSFAVVITGSLSKDPVDSTSDVLYCLKFVGCVRGRSGYQYRRGCTH